MIYWISMRITDLLLRLLLWAGHCTLWPSHLLSSVGSGIGDIGMMLLLFILPRLLLLGGSGVDR